MEVIEHLSPARQASTIEGGALLACLAGMAIMRKLGGEGWLIPHRKDIGAGVAVLVVVAGLVSAGILPEDKWAPLGRHHQRGIILPLAVSPDGGLQTFHASSVAGGGVHRHPSDSLLPIIMNLCAQAVRRCCR